MDPSYLTLEFDIPVEPTFSNDMYWAVLRKSQKRKSGYWAVMATTTNLKWFQNKMKELLPTIIPDEQRRNFKYAFDTGVYDVQVSAVHTMHYKRFYEMDASNLIKAVEDCIARYLGIDDSRTSRYEVEKVPVNVGDKKYWNIHIVMNLVPRNPLTHGMP